MNTSYYEKDNLTYIINEKNILKIERSKDNIEEIMIVENNIEEIQNKLNDIKRNSKTNKLFEIIKLPLIAFLLSILFAIPIVVTSTFIIQLTAFLCSIKFLIMSGVTLKESIENNKNKKNSMKKEFNLLMNELSKEMQILKKLKSKSKIKNVVSKDLKQINRSETIKILERKLELIKNYANNKKKHILCYENNTLNELIDLFNYSEDDMSFIKLLIEEDMKNNSNEIKNNKAKQKGLNKY